MNPIRNIILEGVDRLGKDTLISGLSNQLGFFQKLHYQKPELLEYYVSEARLFNQTEADIKKAALKKYQLNSFAAMFQMLARPGKYLLNRAHLGEVVYSPRYRYYNGNYVFDLEKAAPPEAIKETLLVLLHTSDFSFIKDDGLSFDFDKKEEEQNDFCRAFENSNIEYKLMIDVSDGQGKFVPSERILNVVIQAYKSIQILPHPIWYVNWTRNEDEFVQHNHFQPDPKRSMS